MHPEHEAAAHRHRRMPPLDLNPLGSDGLEARPGLAVDPTPASSPCVTDFPALTLQRPFDRLLGELGGFHQRPPTLGACLPTRLAAQPVAVLVLTSPRAMGQVVGPARAPPGAAPMGAWACALVVTRWRERWIKPGSGLPMGIGTDSANFPAVISPRTTRTCRDKYNACPIHSVGACRSSLQHQPAGGGIY
jgi:hypothetical protein